MQHTDPLESVRPNDHLCLVERLKYCEAPLADPNLNDEAADRIELLSWALTDVLKVCTSWNLFSTTTIDRKPSSTALRLRAAEAALRGPYVADNPAAAGSPARRA